MPVKYKGNTVKCIIAHAIRIVCELYHKFIIFADQIDCEGKFRGVYTLVKCHYVQD